MNKKTVNDTKKKQRQPPKQNTKNFFLYMCGGCYATVSIKDF